MTKPERFYSRHNFHTNLYDDISFLKDKDVANRETRGYCFVIPVNTAEDAKLAGEYIGEFNDFDPQDAVDAFEQSGGLMYIGYEYSPVIYIALDTIEVGMLPYSNETQIIVGNDDHKYLRLWWD